MKITTRHIDDVLVVDMVGDFPKGSHEIDVWRTSLDSALEGHSGRVILHIQDAEFLRSVHLQNMIGALTHAGVHHDSVSFVTPSERIRSLFYLGHSYWRAYKTVDDALRPPPGRSPGCLIGCILTIVGICIGVYILIRGLLE